MNSIQMPQTSSQGVVTVALFVEWNPDFSEEAFFTAAEARSMRARFLADGNQGDMVTMVTETRPEDSGMARIIKITSVNVFSVHNLLQQAGAKKYQIDTAQVLPGALSTDKVAWNTADSELIQ